MFKKVTYDWIIVGAGAAGIAVAEMLSRMQLKVLIVEQNPLIASETTRDFHEWFHTGILYALSRDKFETAQYLLGAIDDLITYYQHFNLMNLKPLNSGLKIEGDGWFNQQNIHLKYRARPTNLYWSNLIAKSKWFVSCINEHDFLRRRAGCVLDDNHFGMRDFAANFPIKFRGFVNLKGTDFTLNSRVLLSDLLNAFEEQRGEILVNCKVKNLKHLQKSIVVQTNLGPLNAKRVAICTAGGIDKFVDTKVQTSFAPMFVFEGEKENTTSFVELDANQNNCINLISKGNGISLAGGISLPKISQVPKYVDHCLDLHKKRNPALKLVHSYIGKKHEIVTKSQKRNYLFHILPISDNATAISLGKFTLLFSLAPEFIRRIYGINPPINSLNLSNRKYTMHPLLSNTVWYDAVSQKDN